MTAVTSLSPHNVELLHTNSPVAPILDKKDIASFFENGFVIKHKVFTESSLNEMRTACRRLNDLIDQEAQKEIHPHNTSAIKIDCLGTQFVVRKILNQPLALLRAVGCASAEPSLLKYLRSPEIVHAFAGLLGTDEIEHLICQYHPKLPGDQVSFAPHREIYHRKYFDSEWIDLNQEGSYAVAAIAVDAMNPENGGLAIIKESHKHYNIDLVNTEVFPSVAELRQHPLAANIYLNPGDILFMHPFLLHWSEPNTSETQSRYTLLTGFCCEGANHQQYPGECTNIHLKVRTNGFQTTPSYDEFY